MFGDKAFLQIFTIRKDALLSQHPLCLRRVLIEAFVVYQIYFLNEEALIPRTKLYNMTREAARSLL